MRANLGDQIAAKTNRYCVCARARLEFRQEVADVRFHGFLGQEEPLADLAIHEAVRDQLEHLELSPGRLLLELLERACERDDLGAVRTSPRRDRLEAARMVAIPVQDVVPLSSVHG